MSQETAINSAGSTNGAAAGTNSHGTGAPMPGGAGGNTNGSKGGFNGSKLLPGAILIGLGLLALFGNLGLSIAGNVFMGLVFGGVAYYVYRQGVQTGNSGMKLLALPLAGLAVVTLLPGRSTGALFLALIGLAFVVVWRSDISRWWAVIPAGTFAALAATAGLRALPGNVTGFVFLAGLAATFFALTRLRVHAQPWAIYPAGVLAVISLLALFNGGGSWLFPIALLAAGAVLLARSGVEGLGWLEAMLPSSWRARPQQAQEAAAPAAATDTTTNTAIVPVEQDAYLAPHPQQEQSIEPRADEGADAPSADDASGEGNLPGNDSNNRF